MGDMQIRITGSGPDEIVKLQRRLVEVADAANDKSLQGSLRAQWRQQMAPARAELQSRIRALPTSGSTGGRSAHVARGGKSGRSTGLYERIAQLVQVRATTSGRNPGVRIRVDSSRMPAGQQSLPKLLEGVRPWRHPVYGHQDSWVSQPAHPYFAPFVAANRGQWRAAALRAMHDVAAFVNRP